MKRHITRPSRALTGRRGLFAAAATALTLGTLALPAPVDAGDVAQDANVLLEITVTDWEGGVAAVVDEIVPEIWAEPDGVNEAPGACTLISGPPGQTSTYHRMVFECTLPVGLDQIYRLGDSNPIEGFSAIDGSCQTDQRPGERIDGDDAVFTLLDDLVECELEIAPTPVLYVDTVVVGGEAAPGDFNIEIYDDTGAQVDIGTVSDTVVEQCSLERQQFPPLTDEDNCAAITLESGDYTFGGDMVYGYTVQSVSCESFYLGLVEMYSHRDASINHGGEYASQSYCTITMEYVTTTVSADIVVVNDSGRTAAGSEFTIEVFDNNGDLVASGTDPEPGTGNASAEFDLPIGPYVFGFSGPEGYEGSVEIVATQDANEAIPGAAAAFTLDERELAATITVDDQTIATTTTSTTTTTTTTTTVAPSTLAPTTASTVDPNAVLPATGSSNTTTWTMLLIALACLGLGGLTVAGTRRR